MSNLVNAVGTIVTGMVGWLGTFLEFMLSNELLLLVLCISIVGVVVRFIRAIINSAGV